MNLFSQFSATRVDDGIEAILFLDIDGVLNSFCGGGEEIPDTGLHAPNICHLNSIFDNVAFGIVITSDWRGWTPLPELRQLFDLAGVRSKILDTTPIHEQGHRGTEVHAWLAGRTEREDADFRALEAGKMGTRPFAILDDRTDLDPFVHRLVRTDPDIGLTAQDADAVVRILRGG